MILLERRREFGNVIHPGPGQVGSKCAANARGGLITPVGGRLVSLIVGAEERREVRMYAHSLPAVELSPRAVCDLELLATGAFSPLERFMGSADYARVLGEMRLADGTLFPIPVTLPVGEPIREGDVALRAADGSVLGVMRVEECFEWDACEESGAVLGTRDTRHPLVGEMANWGRYLVSGPIKVVGLPHHPDFGDLRLTPAETRRRLGRMGFRNVVAFQTRNPIHRAHEWLTKRAAARIGGALLIHPVVGVTKPGDVDHFTRVRCYRALLARRYDRRRTLLALLPLAMRFAGPREAVWHALIRRNYGANYFIVGRDHASPGLDSSGRPFYPPYAAQELLGAVAEELGVRMVAAQEVVYLPHQRRYATVDRVRPGWRRLALSGTEVRKRLAEGLPLPRWFTRPEVARILQGAHPPRARDGCCIWLTGLPSAGKSTLARWISAWLMERGRTVTLLDGDEVRRELSPDLGFSKTDRDRNVLRMAFVAREVVRHRGIAIVAAVSPYEDMRERARQIVGPEKFVLVYVRTPLEVCESRDEKGLYARARRGEVKGVTGIDDPYEEPAAPDVLIRGDAEPPRASLEAIIAWLVRGGFVEKAERHELR